jgi:hypothetical protein
MKNMTIENIIGKSFNAFDPSAEYICVGYAQNETFIVFGAINDTANNRFSIKSFKLTDCKFKGQVAPS